MSASLAKTIGCTTGLALLVLFGSRASAQRWDKKTELDVRERMAAPGAVLEPGKYVVRPVDSDANRHIVRFLNERQDRVLSTVNYRLEVTGDTQFSWYERPAGQPPTLRAWFYPGDNFGQEFVYPERQAAPIAAAARKNVSRCAAMPTLRTLSGTQAYVVHSIYVVEPDFTEPLGPTAEPTLTLVTCFPFEYIGPAPRRFIVQAAADGVSVPHAAR